MNRRQPRAMFAAESLQEGSPLASRDFLYHCGAPSDTLCTIERQLRDQFERSGLFEQMRGAGHDFELHVARASAAWPHD